MDGIYALTFLMVIPVVYWANVFFSRRTREAVRKQRRIEGTLASNVQEAFYYHKAVMSLSLESENIGDFLEGGRESAEHAVRAGRYQSGCERMDKGASMHAKTGPAEMWGRMVTAAVLLAFFSGCAGGARLTGGTADLPQLGAAMEHDLGTAGQDPSLPQSPELADYLAYAAFHNPGLKAAFEQWKAALWKIPQVRSLPDPRFTYAYFVERVETRVGPQRQRFALAQTFPWLSKLELRGDEAAREAEAKRARYEAAKWQLFERVKKAYFEYAYLRQAVAVTEENIRLLKHLERVVQTQYASSLAPYGALVRLQAELGRLEDRLKGLQDLRGPVSEELQRGPQSTQGRRAPLAGAGAVENRCLRRRRGPQLASGGQSGAESAEPPRGKRKAGRGPGAQGLLPGCDGQLGGGGYRPGHEQDRPRQRQGPRVGGDFH